MVGEQIAPLVCQSLLALPVSKTYLRSQCTSSDQDEGQIKERRPGEHLQPGSPVKFEAIRQCMIAPRGQWHRLAGATERH